MLDINQPTMPSFHIVELNKNGDLQTVAEFDGSNISTNAIIKKIERQMAYDENDYISFTEFLRLVMSEYIIDLHRGRKICEWCNDSRISANDIHFAHSNDGKKTRFYNRNDLCVVLTKK